MWNLNFDKLHPLAPEGLGTIAIETGTCRGNGARALAGRFERVITIELSEALHRSAQERLAPFTHVECIHGNSAAELRRILPTLPDGETIFFFLDAHWSGDKSVDWQKSEWKGYGLDTAHLGASSQPSGPEQCPLLDELAAIMEYCRGPAFLLIDDVKNIPKDGQGLQNSTFEGEDWSHLSRAQILSLLEPRLASVQELEDPAQLFVAISPKEKPQP